MEVWLTAAVGFDALNGKVNICGTGTNPLAYISNKDVLQKEIEVGNISEVALQSQLDGAEDHRR